MAQDFEILVLVSRNVIFHRLKLIHYFEALITDFKKFSRSVTEILITINFWGVFEIYVSEIRI